LHGEDRIYWLESDAAASLSGRPVPRRGRGSMSTAGKVLTVLILLVMVLWIVMMSPVSQLNANYGQKVESQQKELEKLTTDVADANKAITTLTEQARVEQDATERDLRLLLSRISAAERRQSSTSEDLSRIKIQLADYLAAVEKAKTNLATREAEKAKGEDDLAKKKDEIAKSQAKNAELRAELAQLQEDFKRLLTENTKALQKPPVAKPASNVRTSPSS
jgi:chromosome segregation ATPase